MKQHAGMAELADARDLKSCGTFSRAGSIPVSGTIYRGVEQLVARRAHNPEVAGSSPVPATKRKSVHASGRIFVCILHHSSFIFHSSLSKERIFE